MRPLLLDVTGDDASSLDPPMYAAGGGATILFLLGALVTEDGLDAGSSAVARGAGSSAAMGSCTDRTVPETERAAVAA